MISWREVQLRNIKIGRHFFYAELFLVFLFLLPSCLESGEARRMAGELASDGLEINQEPKVKGLKSQIKALDKDIDRIIEKQKDKSRLWRMLGYRYMNMKMWGEALDALNESLMLEPENVSARYNRGLARSHAAKLLDSESQKREYFLLTERDYSRVLSLDSRYTPAMYAWAILLVFELQRPFEAEPLLKQFLSIERSHLNARFLLAKIFVESDRKEQALVQYEEIMRLAKNTSDRNKAKELYTFVSGGVYGS